MKLFYRINEFLNQRSFAKNVELIICGARSKGIIGWKPFQVFLLMPLALPLFFAVMNVGDYILGLFSVSILCVFELFWIPIYTDKRLVFWKPTIKKYSLEIEVIFWIAYVCSLLLSVLILGLTTFFW